MLGLLASNRFLTVKSGASLRELLRRKFALDALYDLGDTKLFTAAVLPVVVVAKKQRPETFSTCIFDRVYEQASLTSSPLTDVQTTTVPPGGATIVEFNLQVPGRYMLVDHALSRLERGLVGFLFAEGKDNLAVFHGAVTPGSGH